MPPQTPAQPRNELIEWYQSIPPITKAIFTLSIATTVAPALGLVSPYYLILNWTAISKLQVRVFIFYFFFRYSQEKLIPVYIFLTT